jgi:hypothetical protein
MNSRNMASVLALAASAALVGVGCAAQAEDPATQGNDEQQIAASEDTATVAAAEHVGEAKQAWWGGWGGWGGYPGWGGGWGGWGGWPGWGGGWGGWGGGWGGWGGWGGCGGCGGWGGWW